MTRLLTTAILAVLPSFLIAAPRPIGDAVGLNIGVTCQWQAPCMAQQRRSMRRALGYVAHAHPPQWRVQLCNRNAGKGGGRVDWSGYDHCIRNAALRPAVQVKRRAR